MVKIGDILDTKQGLYLVIDVYDKDHCWAVDWETQLTSIMIHSENILEVIELPKNIGIILLKKMDKVTEEFFDKKGI